jgi:hypothetical protein
MEINNCGLMDGVSRMKMKLKDFNQNEIKYVNEIKRVHQINHVNQIKHTIKRVDVKCKQNSCLVSDID